MKRLPKYSMGIGDRFAHQGRAQLAAMRKMADGGVEVTPVWNKSAREHAITHTSPGSVRAEADAATRALGWCKPYFVDADHINFATVDAFIESADFFTLDVAAAIDGEIAADAVGEFVDRWSRFVGDVAIPGIASSLPVGRGQAIATVRRYLPAVREAGRIYRKIASVKGAGTFVTEVSMDETDSPQTPADMLFILAAIAEEGIPAQTIAPRFCGRFNKGVDYVGNPAAFQAEFEADLAVLAYAVGELGLPDNLKLSVHSGSDKFSIYGPIGQAIRKFDAGLHLKTAGTTWLEEIVGLAEAGGDGLEIAREIYRAAYARRDELCAPYAEVIAIQANRLPAPETVDRWTGADYAAALRHEPSCPRYNPDFRQLLHVGYKVAAEMGARYALALETYEATVARNVTENLYSRHLKAVFRPAAL